MIFAENSISGQIVSASSGERVAGEQINVYIPDYGYLGRVVSGEDGLFSVSIDEFPEADNVILNSVNRNGEMLLIAKDAGAQIGSGSETLILESIGYTVENIKNYASYSELMSIMHGVEVDEDVAMFNRLPVRIFVNGYIWPLSFDENKSTERVEETPPKQDYVAPLFSTGSYKVVINPSNPIRFGDFRGDNMRTLMPTPTKNFVQYRLSVLDEFYPIELIGRATFISPDEMREKFGTVSNSAIVVLWTSYVKASNESSRSSLIRVGRM